MVRTIEVVVRDKKQAKADKCERILVRGLHDVYWSDNLKDALVFLKQDLEEICQA